MTDPINISCPGCLVTNRIPRSRLEDNPTCGKCKQALFTAKPLEATEANFRKLVGQCDIPVIIDCWAAWCGPCQSFAPTFAEAAKALSPHYRLIKLDTQSNPNLATQLNIRSIPTVIAYKDSKEVTRQAGALPLASFLQWVKQF